jgi:hypothetical protein
VQSFSAFCRPVFSSKYWPNRNTKIKSASRVLCVLNIHSARKLRASVSANSPAPRATRSHNNIRNTKQASSIICKRGSQLAVIGGAAQKKRGAHHTRRESSSRPLNSRAPLGIPKGLERAVSIYDAGGLALLVFGLGMSSSTINRTHAHTIPQGVFRYILTNPRHSVHHDQR